MNQKRKMAVIILHKSLTPDTENGNAQQNHQKIK